MLWALKRNSSFDVISIISKQFSMFLCASEATRHSTSRAQPEQIDSIVSPMHMGTKLTKLRDDDVYFQFFFAVAGSIFACESCCCLSSVCPFNSQFTPCRARSAVGSNRGKRKVSRGKNEKTMISRWTYFDIFLTLFFYFFTPVGISRTWKKSSSIKCIISSTQKLWVREKVSFFLSFSFGWCVSWWSNGLHREQMFCIICAHISDSIMMGRKNKYEK